MPQILIVNDDPAQLRYAVTLVETHGYEVVACNSSGQALDVLQCRGAVDLVITDLYMPGIDGWRLCRLLRSPAFPDTNDTPILVISGTFSGTDAEDITHGTGANAFLSVPYEPTELLGIIGQLLQGRRERRRCSVLIVDDSKAQRNIVAHGFRSRGYQVLEAEDGKRAAEQYDAHHPDVVVLDYHLPDMTGEALLPGFKASESGTVVIVTTADVSPELAVNLLRSGADAYVRKPFDIEYLTDLVVKAHREHALLRVEGLLEQRTQELRASEARYRAIVEDQTDLVFRFSPDGVLTFVNGAYCRCFGKEFQQWVGQRFLPMILPDEGTELRAHLGALNQEHPLESMDLEVIDGKGAHRWQHWVCRAIFGGEGSLVGFQCVGRDITARKQGEEERTRLIEQLQKAMAEIKTLRGIIPICASCKKIRDDKGYWHSVESYVRDHSEAEFSHGICPECARKLYPDLF